MSRGVVLWPDDGMSRVVANLWASLEAEGIPTLATRSHRQHRPHVSLVVGEDLPPPDVLHVLGSVPKAPIDLLVSSPGVFPGGILFLACVPTPALLEEQRRVHDLVVPMTQGTSEYCEPGTWSPHLTISYGLDDAQLALALPLVLARLPLQGWLTSGGVEDGGSGKRWPARPDRWTD